MPEQREARPVRGDRAGHELDDREVVSSSSGYDEAAPYGHVPQPRTPGEQATPEERRALAAGVCIVCGRADDNLSSLARCWDCIRAASDAWSAKVGAARAIDLDRDPERDPTRTRWDDVWDKHHPPGPRHLRDASPRVGDGPARPTGNVRGRLRGLANTVLNSTEGVRNTVLHWAACRAGEMIAAGEVEEAIVVAVLQEAGLAVGLTPAEVGDAHRGTIGSGLRNGCGGAA